MAERRNRGELEGLIQRILWDAEHAQTARQIVTAFAGLGDGNVPSMTTMLTILDRLVKKGAVRRISGAGDYTFEPTASESVHTAETMASALRGSGDREGALSYFAGRLSADDAALLRKALNDPR